MSLSGARDTGLTGPVPLLLDPCDEFWDPTAVSGVSLPSDTRNVTATSCPIPASYATTVARRDHPTLKCTQERQGPVR